MKIRIAIALTLVFFFSHYSLIKSAPLTKDAGGDISKNIDISSPRQLIIRFLQWYKVNLQKSNNFTFLKKDSAGNFMINRTACYQYLDFLKSSKFLSSRYIVYWRTFFDDKATELQTNPIQADIPEGFDLDLVLITQEPNLVLDHIGQAKFKTLSLNNRDAVIRVSWPQNDGMQYKIEMHRGSKGWQIDYIATPNFD